MQTHKLGWIGLGRMGIPMSQQLIKAGYPLTVYNRSKEKEAALVAAGATAAPAPALLLQQCDMVMVMVSDDNAVREIFTSRGGLLDADSSGKAIINMSTVSPDISREMAAICQRQGHHYVDAPVSGSVKQAEEGQLVIMAGAAPAVFEQVRPVLERMGKLVLNVGGTGAGNIAKLAMNVLLGFHALGLAEAVIFAQQNGVDTAQLFTLINNSALGNVFARIKGEAIVNNNYQPAFALKHIAKDLRLAQARGLHTPMAQVAADTFQQAAPALGEEDIIAVIKHLQQH